MKGIVFNLLQELVTREYGEETWDALLEAAQLEGVYTSLGSYSDEDLLKLVGAASAALQLPATDVVRWFGRNSIPMFAQRYPPFFEHHKSTRAFLLTLNDIIHPEVRKLYPGADVPDFQFDASSDDVLVMEYNSKRKLCAFAEGLIEGTAAHFGERLKLEHPTCMLRGDDRCILRISLEKLPS